MSTLVEWMLERNALYRHLVKKCGQAVTTANKCRACGANLRLDEMHYYADEDGTATCDKCEQRWSARVAVWRAGDDPDEQMPEKP